MKRTKFLCLILCFCMLTFLVACAEDTETESLSESSEAMESETVSYSEHQNEKGEYVAKTSGNRYDGQTITFLTCSESSVYESEIVENIKTYEDGIDDIEVRYKIAQARAMRAFSYLQLAPYFQFGYAAGGSDLPCVPIVTETTTDFTANPRASVADVYALIIADLTYAIEALDGYVRTDKSRVDQQVAYGLRARAYLNMQEWALAAEDAAAAAEGCGSRCCRAPCRSRAWRIP